jgi:hypothetical protein
MCGVAGAHDCARVVAGASTVLARRTSMVPPISERVIRKRRHPRFIFDAMFAIRSLSLLQL